jgi:hypothetical protein
MSFQPPLADFKIESAEQFTEDLTERIKATVGKGPLLING